MKGKGQQSTVYDVAKYIIDNWGPMSAMKLQKLVFIHKLWQWYDDVPLFEDDFEAWAKGLYANLFNAHKGKFMLSDSSFLDSYNQILRIYQVIKGDH
ncbi:MAG: hypothetical protein ACLRZ2_00180 [Veillonella sp.]